MTGLLGLVALLSSCAPPLPPSWRVRVINDASYLEPEQYSTCEGGLRLRLMFGVTEFDSGLVPAGGVYSVGDPDYAPYDADVGDWAEAEGWCFGAEAEELGYVRTAGPIAQPNNISQANTTLFGVPLSDVARQDCLAGTEAHGTRPCLKNDLF